MREAGGVAAILGCVSIVAASLATVAHIYWIIGALVLFGGLLLLGFWIKDFSLFDQLKDSKPGKIFAGRKQKPKTENYDV